MGAAVRCPDFDEGVGLFFSRFLLQGHRHLFVFIVSFARASVLVFWLFALFVSFTVHIARVAGQDLSVPFMASVSISLRDKREGGEFCLYLSLCRRCLLSFSPVSYWFSLSWSVELCSHVQHCCKRLVAACGHDKHCPRLQT